MNRRLQALQIFESAMELAPEQRNAFVQNACADEEVLREVLELMSTSQDDDDFLATDVIQPKPPRVSGVLSNSGIAAPGSRFSPGDELQDRYRIFELLGAGGMGEVFRARDVRLDRDVAIKVIHHQGLAGHELPDRFDRELKAVASLSAPNVVTLFDYVMEGDVPFAVMEFAVGDTLETLISRGIELSSAIHIAHGIACGLAAAHQRDIMHRDIKPANIIVAEDGTAKILDFGLARSSKKLPSQQLTSTSMTPGTVPYMSPEQAEGNELTCATDVFSLGTVFCEMLTGRNPFRGDSALETLNKVARADPPSLSDELPERLVALIHSMLERDMESRPTAADVREELAILGAQHDDSAMTTAQLGEASPHARSGERRGRPKSSTTHIDDQGRTKIQHDRRWQPSLIVLPFQVFGTDESLEAIAAGLVENLTTILTRVPMLSITSRMSSFSLKGPIGHGTRCARTIQRGLYDRGKHAVRRQSTAGECAVDRNSARNARVGATV